MYESLRGMTASGSHVQGEEFEEIVVSFQTVKVFHSSAPDRAGAVFVEHRDGPGLAVVVFGNHDCEHGRRSRLLICQYNTSRRLPAGIEENEAGVCRDP